MRSFILILCLLCSSSSWAAARFAPDATYSGQGQLTRLADGTHFSYNVTYVLASGSVTATYSYPNGYSYTLGFTTTDGSNGQINVQVQGQPAGSGYCIGGSCHVNVTYQLNGTTTQVSVTMTYVGDGDPTNHQNKLIVSGSNATSNSIWEDVLSP